MEKESFIMLMEISMKENLKMIKQKAMVNINVKFNKFTYFSKDLNGAKYSGQ